MTDAEWAERTCSWTKSAIWYAQIGCDPPPMIREPVAPGWHWANGVGFSDEEALLVAQVRSYGCRCRYPLLGWTMPAMTPRCRTCNAEAE